MPPCTVPKVMWRCRRAADALQHLHASKHPHWTWCSWGFAILIPCISLLLYFIDVWLEYVQVVLQRWMDSLWKTTNLQGGRWRGMVRKSCPLSQWGAPFPSYLMHISSESKHSPYAYSCSASYICLGLREGLQQFWAWLEDVGNECGRSILLAAHNGSGFDFPVLMVLLPLVLLSWFFVVVDNLCCCHCWHFHLLPPCMIAGKHGQSWPHSAPQSSWQSPGSWHSQSLQVKRKLKCNSNLYFDKKTIFRARRDWTELQAWDSLAEVPPTVEREPGGAEHFFVLVEKSTQRNANCNVMCWGEQYRSTNKKCTIHCQQLQCTYLQM